MGCHCVPPKAITAEYFRHTLVVTWGDQVQRQGGAVELKQERREIRARDPESERQAGSSSGATRGGRTMNNLTVPLRDKLKLLF